MLEKILFPKNEDWASGDEAIDLRLTKALDQCFLNLSKKTIRDFQTIGLSQKTRIQNKFFHTQVMLVVKALLYALNPEGFIDEEYDKFQGFFDDKQCEKCEIVELQSFFKNLKNGDIYRYKDQLDFHIVKEDTSERNPFVRQPLLKSGWSLRVKIKWKEYRAFLNHELSKPSVSYSSDKLLFALREKEKVFFINEAIYLWYNHHDEQIYSILDSKIRESLNV